MCYFFINILKIVLSARHSVIIHQTFAFVILLAKTLLYYSAIFVGGDARFGFVPRCRLPSLRYWYSHSGLWKVCNYIELSQRWAVPSTIVPRYIHFCTGTGTVGTF